MINKYLRDIIAESALNKSGSFVLPFPDPRGRHDLQLLPRRELFLELNVHLLLEFSKVFRLLDVSKDVLDKCV